MKSFSFCLLFAAMLLLFSCHTEDNVSIPGDVLQKEEMAAVLVDVNLLEASMNTHFGSSDKIAASGDTYALQTDMLKKHGLTQEQYQHSFEFYGRHPKLFAEVYQLVLNDLSRMQAEVSNAK